MVKLIIDDIEVEVPDGATVLQACELAGVEIPRFCYHESLSVAGNCRMCLVEMDKSPKPIASCAMPASNGMIIKTDTDLVLNARKGVMEFLLINHPLDCPICDQGGECDLQDQAMYFGKGDSRFKDLKRAVSDKDMGPLIKTTMTRCIHCTRCVRFANEVAGVENLGAIGRGENVEITTYLEKTISSELSGNLIDLCPVGALTSKPYAFAARPWELEKTESIDVMDSTGSNIRIDSRDGKVLRVLPRSNEFINEEWISDKTRFAIDGLSKQRLDNPYVRENGKLKVTSWENAFDLIKQNLKGLSPKYIAAVIVDQVDAESIFSLKKLYENIGTNKISLSQYDKRMIKGNRSNYLFNSSILGIEKADAILFVGSNPRYNAPVINARIRKNFLKRAIDIALIGSNEIDLTYEYNYLGSNIDLLNDILNGSNKFFKVLEKANYPMIILGDEVLNLKESEHVQSACIEILNKVDGFKTDWNGYNILNSTASIVASFDILNEFSSITHDEILSQCKEKRIKFLYLLGVDEVDYDYMDTFVIYQGHHGDLGANKADVILPGSAYTEKSSTFVNLEGRYQMTERAVFPPGVAKEDWAIIRAISDLIGKKINFDTLQELRNNMCQEEPNIYSFKQDSINPKPIKHNLIKFSAYDLISTNRNFYMTCPISRTSDTMAECIKFT